MTSTKKYGAGIGALAITIALACGADERTREEPTAQARALEVPERGDEPAEPPPPRDVPGAAPTAGGEIPVDIVPLASRYAPRALSIPRVAAGRSAAFTFDGGKRGWFARLPEGPQELLTPTYASGRVYLGGGFASHQLYALEATSGRIDWMASAPDGGPTAAIALGDEILFNTESCTLFAVDAATGRQRWSRWLGDPLMSQPAAENGRVFSGHIRDGGGYGFTAMDVDTGRVRWTRAISADVMNAPVLDGSSVFFTTMDGVVWRFDQATGRRVWRRALRATSAPWLHDDTVHVARRKTTDGRREEQSVVLSIEDGSLLREHDAVTGRFAVARPDGRGVQAGWAYEGSRPTIVDGRLYQTIGDEVQSRDADTGELLWRRRYTQRAWRRPASPPAVAGGQLVFGTRDGVLYGLDIDTGMTAWAYDVGTPITSQPTVAHGWVFASTARGGVVGLEVGDTSVGGWHMWGGDARHNGPVEEAAHEAPVASDDRPTEGTLRLRGAPEDGELAGFPLVATSVDARVSGFAARVEVEQTFENPYSRAIEAVYLFPLPDDAAVDAMELHAGGRVIRGQIRERTEARREYRQARDRGVLASLLEQERPNLFRQAIANLLPGERVRVVLRYTQVLPYEAGSYRFVFPMVAGPRYAPQAEADDASEADVSQVAIAPGEERSDRVDVTISASLGGTLHDVTSPTHELSVARPSERSARVTLSQLTPDRDLDVRFVVAGDEPSLAVLASPPRAERPGYASILVHPRLEVPDAQITPRELVVVVDTSSSMRGRPFELARAAGLRALEGLRETDTFRVVRFSDRASELTSAALPATAENVARARTYLASMTALGATEMRRGLRAALEPAIEPGRLRIVLLLTDGYIGNESEVLREIGARLGQSRVFALGVGAAANRYLLSRVSEVGRGDTSVVTLDESPTEAADAFIARIASPYLTDIELDWGELTLESVYPRRAPDLFADRPLVLHGRYARGGRGIVTIRGRIAGAPFEQRVSVELPSEAEPREEVASLWARTRIRDLMTQMALRPSDALREEVTQIGLEHSLVTQWTSFVAIDEGYPRTDGRPTRVREPSALPSGTDYGGDARHVGNPGAGSGGLGMVGTGRGGGGYGMGTIGLGTVGHAYGAAGGAAPAPRQPARVPVIRAGVAEVRGSLSREVIRRSIRRQLNAVRYCYEQNLARAPGIEGRVTVSFVIAADGSVESASVSSSTLGDAATEQCIVAVVQRITFPAVDGAGLVAVNYPFVLHSEDEAQPSGSTF